MDAPFSWPDKLYDYLIEEGDAGRVHVGSRVRVVFAGKKRAGFVVDIADETTSQNLVPLEKVYDRATSAEVIEVCRGLSRDHVAPLFDVLRSAIPPRHARAEKADRGSAPLTEPSTGPQPGHRYVPAIDLDVLAEAVAQCHGSGHSSLIIVPTGADVREVTHVLARALPGQPIASLTADDSAEVRYRTHLAILGGRTAIVVGTRAAALTPLANIGLVATVDECNSAMRDKRSPYLWADEILRRRMGEGTFLHLGTPRLARPVSTEKVGRWPRVSTPDQWSGDQRGFLPQAAFDVIRAGLEKGPVLVSAPRPGYVPALSCEACGQRAVCQDCGSPLAVPGPGSSPSCQTCGQAEWSCQCGSVRLRARSRGTERLAQELAAAFPGGLDVVRSAGQSSSAPLVLATPGAEPHREFASGVILDAGLSISSGFLDSGIHSLARWTRVARRVRDHLLLVGQVPPVLAESFAQRELSWLAEVASERQLLGQPPHHRWFKLSGPRPDIEKLLGAIGLALDGEAPPEQSIADMLTGGGVQAFAAGLYMVGPVDDDGGLSLYLHEEAPADRLISALHRALSQRVRVRVESDPVL